MSPISRRLPLAALAVMLAAPVAQAQVTIERTRPPAGERAMRVFINGQEVDVQNAPDLLFNRRARLGVTVNLQAQPNDSVGATISAVTPGGPAFRAGIQSGDIIIRLDGTSVTAGPRPENAEADQSLPGLRLVELASRLAPDDTIPVEFKRGSQRRTVSLVTGNAPIALGDLLDGERRMLFRGPEGDREILVERMPGGNLSRVPFTREGMTLPPGTFDFRIMTRFADLELAPLNPDLGSYFGATEGVLVVRVGEHSTLGLKGGDVLLAIDGRRATSPAAALRILRSYETGETVRLEVLRNRQRQTVSATIGERE